MPSDSQSYLTIREAAELLRTSPHTVYRWCRSGRLHAIKLGKEWRIPAQQLRREGDLAGLLPLDALLAALAGRSEHLLGLARDRAALARMEAAFFEVAAATGGHLAYGLWANDGDEIRRRLRPILAAGRVRKSSVRVVNLASTYERRGANGIVALLCRQAETAKSARGHCYVCGPPQRYFGYHHDRLVAYETQIQRDITGLNAVWLCGYVLNELGEDMSLPLVMQLLACHSGVIFFDGQQALLVRVAG